MEFRQLTGAALSTDADVLAFVTFGDPSKDALLREIDKALGGHLSESATAESFTGKPLQSLTVHTHGKISARRVIVIGGGAKSEFSIPSLRDVTATLCAAAARFSAKSIAFVVPALGTGKERSLVQASVEGVLLGAYKFNRYLTGDEHKKPSTLASFDLLLDSKGKKPSAAQTRAVKDGTERATIVAHAINHARDLVNEPAAAMTPTQLAAEATAIAKKNPSVTVQILGPKECEKLGMGMFLGVAKGSAQEPRLIHMTYKPGGAKAAKSPKSKSKAPKKICLIGKGITFDSGGYSLKPSNGMEDMKVDMSGAAAVICAMEAIANIGSTYEVHAVAACCENMVSGNAYKLGDVLKSMDGTTVEINNTDAEGRLILGDAITYARTKIEPDEMFDFATLTGACMVALGPYTAGVFSDNEAMVRGWMSAAQRSGEDMWRLPLNGRLRDQLKSNVADMRNTGDRFGGAITAGLFLKTFVKTTPWMHVDIAGPASVSTSRAAQPKGGTGFAVSTIVEYAAIS